MTNDEHLEAAYLMHSTIRRGGKHTLSEADKAHVRDIIAAWVGDRPLYGVVDPSEPEARLRVFRDINGNRIYMVKVTADE